MTYRVTKHSGKVHEVARCNDCGWRNENYKNALATAKRHAQAHGHHVTCEQGIAIDYWPAGGKKD